MLCCSFIIKPSNAFQHLKKKSMLSIVRIMLAFVLYADHSLTNRDILQPRRETAIRLYPEKL